MYEVVLMDIVQFALPLTLAMIAIVRGDAKLWSQWWSYKGISGPDYWGLLNQDWSLCTKGQHQSPVDINPRNLVFDPNLRPVRMDAHRVDGYVVNTGHDITLYINESNPRPFAFTGGPLSYTYRVHHIKLHFGSLDLIGSEHTVAGKPFPLEIYGYNTELFPTFQEASLAAHGVAAVAVFGSIGNGANSEFDQMVKAIRRTPYKDNSTPVVDFSVTTLVPETHDYMTYEGSMTQPGCLETVTWVVFNKPLHIQKEQLALLRRLHEASDVDSPPLLMENNFRNPMPVNRRTVRTNIRPDQQVEAPQSPSCRKGYPTSSGVGEGKVARRDADHITLWYVNKLRPSSTATTTCRHQHARSCLYHYPKNCVYSNYLRNLPAETLQWHTCGCSVVRSPGLRCYVQTTC